MTIRLGAYMAVGEGATLPGASAAGAMTGLIGAWDRAGLVLNVRTAGAKRGSLDGPAAEDRATLRGRKTRRAAVRAGLDMVRGRGYVLVRDTVAHPVSCSRADVMCTCVLCEYIMVF